MRSLLVVVLLAAAAAGQTASPDLTGTWRLDRDLTTADLRWNKATIVAVSQSEDEVRFDYFDGDQVLGSETFVTDDEERPRYTTRLARAYARARWRPNELVITTRVFLDLYGHQSYSEGERWKLSDEGKTLTDNWSDGKAIVYYKLSETPRSASRR